MDEQIMDETKTDKPQLDTSPKTDRILTLEETINDSFDFDAPQKITPVDSKFGDDRCVKITDIWLEENDGRKELLFELNMFQHYTKTIRFDWENERDEIKSIFKIFGVSSRNAGDIIGQQAYMSSKAHGLFFPSEFTYRFYNTLAVRHRLFDLFSLACSSLMLLLTGTFALFGSTPTMIAGLIGMIGALVSIYMTGSIASDIYDSSPRKLGGDIDTQILEGIKLESQRES